MRDHISTPSKRESTKYRYLVPLLMIAEDLGRAGNTYRYFVHAEAAMKLADKIPNMGVYMRADNKITVNSISCFVWYRIL